MHIDPPIFVTGRFRPFNTKGRLELLFPSPDSPDFIQCVRENWKNRKRDPRLKNGQFAWFYQVTKMVNWRYREKPTFVRWLMLCVGRPWVKADFFLSWDWSAKDFKRAMEVVGKVEVFDTTDVSPTIFYRLKDDCLLRQAVKGIYTWGYENWISYWKYREDKGKLRDSLISQKMMMKRDLQRKLRIKADRLEALLDEFRKESLVRERRLRQNSVQIIWTGEKASKKC